VTSEADRRFMALAVALGARGLGGVWPNPAVGCVIVCKNRIVGRGWTQEGGRPHAETIALAQAGEAARGSTVYVSLEPCAHQGVTPPCAGSLIAAGVARVVTAIEDPDPRVQGKGHAMLRAAGIRVDTGVLADKAEDAQRGFLSRIRRGRPMVTLKLAVSFDGRIATASGESQWITGPEARRRTHAMRATHDAVLIGAGTARADDPMLTVRGLGVDRQPVRIVVARNLDLPRDGALARSARKVPLWLLHGQGAPTDIAQEWADLGANLLPIEERGGLLDPQAMLVALGQAGLTRIFCEGGSKLAASLLAADLVDELVIFTAGIALGADGLAALGVLPALPLAETPRFDLCDLQHIGPDTFSLWSRH
jgi:diaminohydroxyphosphoribosylaminopyrimidine deaminase/5-amino-6-(5-phosphoribosylamino)uracil reductase